MKGSALLLALGKPKIGAPAPGEAETMADQGADSTAKADLGMAVEEMLSAGTPEARAEAFLSCLTLADSCKADE